MSVAKKVNYEDATNIINKQKTISLALNNQNEKSLELRVNDLVKKFMEKQTKKEDDEEQKNMLHDLARQIDGLQAKVVELQLGGHAFEGYHAETQIQIQNLQRDVVVLRDIKQAFASFSQRLQLQTDQVVKRMDNTKEEITAMHSQLVAFRAELSQDDLKQSIKLNAANLLRHQTRTDERFTQLKTECEQLN
jgi:uncharacterized protein YukE